MKIRISSKRLIFFLLEFLFVIKTVVAIFPALEPLAFLTDIIGLGILIFALKSWPHRKNKYFKILCFLILFLLVYDLIEFMVRKQDLLLFLWGMRNQYRFILFTLSAAILLSYDDFEEIIHVIDKWFAINMIVITIEFLMGYQMDDLGGTFGLDSGCNAIVNIFLCIVLTIKIIYWLNKQISGYTMLLYTAGCIYWAALAELKAFFLEFLLIIVLSVFLVKGTGKRKVSVIVLSVIALLIGTNILMTVSPYYKNFFNYSSIVRYFNTVNIGEGGFGRTTALKKINNEFFDDNRNLMLFGMGTGSGEFSSINMLNSQIYKKFEKYQYYSYFHAFMYVERGYLGLLWYFCFFGSPFIIALRKLKNKESAKGTCLLQISAVTSGCWIVIMIYDIGLRTSTSAYLAFLFCAIPYLIRSETEASSSK